MSRTRTKSLGSNLPVPQSKDEAQETIRIIGDLSRSLARLETEMNDEIALIKLDYEQRADPCREAIHAKREGLKIWADANRTMLTMGDKTKTVDLGTGKISWRLRPPSVRLTKVEEIIARIKTLGLQRFIRTKEEVDKEAMLREPQLARTLSGVSIGTEGEDFIVEPYEMELAAGAFGGGAS
jgi:phage host-nuclease inhibitor protein Gam